MPKLSIQSGEETGKVFKYDSKVLTIGRSVNNDMQIVDRRMSRNHSEINFRDGQYFLKDLGSKNGTLLNGSPVVEEIVIRSGDLIQVGDTHVLFETEGTGSDSIESNTSSPELTMVASSSQLKKLNSQVKVVDEDNWGNTKGEIRAGIRATGFDSSSSHTQKHLEILYEVMEAVRSTFSLGDLLEQIMDTIIKVIVPDRAYFLIKDQYSGQLQPEVIRDTRKSDAEAIKISSSIVNRCFNEGVSLLVSDAAQDSRFNASESIIMNQIRTAMVAPLVYKSEKMGVIYIDTNTRAFPYMDGDLELLTGIANQAALAITNSRLHSQLVEQHKVAREMEIARTIQMNLLPKVYPSIKGYDVSAMSLPAKHVGGDYYDFIELPNNRIGFAIADVSGKGVPAAILTATTRSYLQSETQQPGTTIVEAVQRINKMVHRDVTNDMYVTMALIYLEPESGEIEYVNAGHSHPILLKHGGDIQFLDEGGLFLGIIESGTYESAKVHIDYGDVLVLETDGVTDIHNEKSEPFGAERLYSLIREHSSKTAEEIRNAIYRSCVAHRGSADQFDDFTLIVIKRKLKSVELDSSDSLFEELDID